MSKPSSKPQWTVGNTSPSTVRVEPGASKKTEGFGISERPAREFLNWLFFNFGEWIDYFEGQTDFIGNAKQVIVDAGATPSANIFNTLQAAHDAAIVTPGTKILVVSDLTITEAVQISKNDIEIEFRPGKKLILDPATTTGVRGLEVVSSCDRLILKNVWFQGFTNAGDVALWIDVAAAHALLFRLMFDAGLTANIADNSNNTYQNLGQIDL